MSKNSTDFGAVLKWSLIGFLTLIGLKLVFGQKANGAPYGGLLDFIKNLFNWGGGSGSSTTNATTLGGSSASSGGSSMQSVGLAEAKHFKITEYFKNNVFPTDAMHKANYNRLIKILDRLRSEFGSQIIIVKGYEPNGEIEEFKNCTAVRIQPMNGKIENLYDLTVSLENSNTIEPIFRALLNVQGYKTLHIQLK